MAYTPRQTKESMRHLWRLEKRTIRISLVGLALDWDMFDTKTATSQWDICAGFLFCLYWWNENSSWVVSPLWDTWPHDMSLELHTCHAEGSSADPRPAGRRWRASSISKSIIPLLFIIMQLGYRNCQRQRSNADFCVGSQNETGSHSPLQWLQCHVWGGFLSH